MDVIDHAAEALLTRTRRHLTTPTRRRLARRTLGPVVVALRSVLALDDVVHLERETFEPDRPAPVLQRFDDVQLPSDGFGPVFHRRYALSVRLDEDPADVLSALTQDPNRFFPTEVGHVEADDDAGDVDLALGRDVVVELTGPYNGPCRVVASEPTMVRLQTRQSHLEAGVIEFRVDESPGGPHAVVVESWARSADPLMDRVYRSGVGAVAQQYMWTQLCRGVAAMAGRPGATVTILTERLPPLPAQAGEVRPGAAADPR